MALETQTDTELSTAPRIPGEFLVVLVAYQDSWWIPGGVLALSYQDSRYSWWSPGTFLPGFLVFLVESWHIPSDWQG